MKKNKKQNRVIFVKEIENFLISKGAIKQVPQFQKNLYYKLNDFSFIIEPEFEQETVYTVYCRNIITLKKCNFHVFDVHGNINEVIYDFIMHFNELMGA